MRAGDRDGVGLGYACDGYHFDGLVDDVGLYSWALSEAERELVFCLYRYTRQIDLVRRYEGTWEMSIWEMEHDGIVDVGDG